MMSNTLLPSPPPPFAAVKLIHELNPEPKTRWAFFRNPTSYRGDTASGIILYETPTLYCIRLIQVEGKDTYNSRSRHTGGRVHWILKRLAKVEENNDLEDKLIAYRTLAAVHLLERIHAAPLCKGKYTPYGDRSLWIQSLRDIQTHCMEAVEDTSYWECERIIQWIQKEDRAIQQWKGKGKCKLGKDTAFKLLKKGWVTGQIFHSKTAEKHSPLRQVDYDDIRALIILASSIMIPRFIHKSGKGISRLNVDLLRLVKKCLY